MIINPPVRNFGNCINMWMGNIHRLMYTRPFFPITFLIKLRSAMKKQQRCNVLYCWSGKVKIASFLYQQVCQGIGHKVSSKVLSYSLCPKLFFDTLKLSLVSLKKVVLFVIWKFKCSINFVNLSMSINSDRSKSSRARRPGA